MTEQSTADQVMELIADHLCVPRSSLRLDAKLEEDLDADSLDAVEILLMCDEYFQCDISGADLDKLVTIQDFINLVESKVTA